VPLHGEHLLLYGLDNRKIAVNNEIEDRVQDLIHAVFQLLGRRLQLTAQLAMGARGPMPNGYDVAGSDEDVSLTIADLLTFQVRCAGDHEELTAVNIDLGKLSGVEGVFDRKRVQVEAQFQVVQFSFVRID
jgi:hypothetical protein